MYRRKPDTTDLNDSSRMNANEEMENNNSIMGDEKFRMKREEDHREDLVSFIRLLLSKEDIPEEFEDWSYERQRDWIVTEGANRLKDLPKTLLPMFMAIIRPGDCGRSPLDRPKWLDMEKFRRGQKFAMDHIAGISFSNIIALYLIFAFKNGLAQLILTNRSNTPYRAFKRYLSTVNRTRNWYITDPWTQGTAGHKDIQTVRKLHRSLREHLINTTKDEVMACYKISNPWCPMANILSQDFASLKTSLPAGQRCAMRTVDESPSKPKGLNQLEMALTQFAFVGLVVLYPSSFGVHYATEEDFEAFCHVWRGIGYLLGVEDEYNFLKGDMEEVRQRCRDTLDYWVKPRMREYNPEWEHMTRCLTSGTAYYFPPTNFTVGLLYLSDILELPMPTVRKMIDFPTWFAYLMAKFMFYGLSRFSRVLDYMNRGTNLAVDKGLNFSPEKHEELRQKSAKTLLDFVTS